MTGLTFDPHLSDTCPGDVLSFHHGHLVRVGTYLETMTMPSRSPLARAAAAVALAAAAACATAPRETPPTAASVHAPHHSAAASEADADVRFMQQMIAHHGQALTMTELVPTRTTREEILLLAERIAVSQRDEIAQMQRWLRARGADVPEAMAHAGHAGMPGMLTPEELARLAAASGAEFDRLFLASMIRHHEGALTMVAELFASPGGGQEPDVFRIASEVDSDQRMEIARMRRVQSAPAATQPR